jgi:hypothetical protein
VKHHYTKKGDGIYVIGREQNYFLFLFSTNKFLSFVVSRMSVEKNFVEKMQK